MVDLSRPVCDADDCLHGNVSAQVLRLRRRLLLRFWSDAKDRWKHKCEFTIEIGTGALRMRPKIGTEKY